MRLGLVALAVVLVFAYRVYREPRRVSHAVLLGIALMFGGYWLVDESGMQWLKLTVFTLITLTVFALPWALIANGVVMMRREGRSLANLLSFLAGLAVIGLFGVTLAAVAFSRSRWLVAAAMSLVLVAGYLAFMFTALLAYSALYSRFSHLTSMDAIIVLGSGLVGDSVPPLLANRLDRAIDCLRRAAGSDPMVVVSGGRGADESISEAAAMRDYLLDAGVPAERILLEDKALTTEQNLRFSVDLLTGHGRADKIVAVTNNYHVFRTAVLSRRLGLRLNVVGARTASYFVPSAFLREFVALLAQYPRVNLAAMILLAAAPPITAALGH